MSHRLITFLTAGGLGFISLAMRPARSDEPRVSAPAGTASSPGQARQAAERGLAFLEKDALKWRSERKCASCHHGTMTVWALSEAKSRGYPVTAELSGSMAAWTKERLQELDKPRDTRPGWNMVNTPAVFLAVMA